MRIELTDDPTAFVAKDWSALVEADPAGTFFHTPAYLKLWWEEFGTGLLVLARAVDADGDVAACAYEVLDGTLTFLGGLDVTDYMGPVALPGREEVVAKELMAAMAADVVWERADLRGVPSNSVWPAALEMAGDAQGLRVERGGDGVAPALHLPATFDGYLAGLPAKLRHEIRRKERRLRAAMGDYRVTLATEASLAADYDRFFELHRSSPGSKGKFMHPGMEIFFRRLGEALLPRHVFHLAFLEAGGRRAAGAVGFAYKNTFSLYNSAFDRSVGALSPGMVLVADMIAGAIADGRDTFDLLKGDVDYKYRFGAVARPVERLVLERR
jgi:CelD/BcsL family acetyltransferase involved in cellulose biosynthesis